MDSKVFNLFTYSLMDDWKQNHKQSVQYTYKDIKHQIGIIGWKAKVLGTFFPFLLYFCTQSYKKNWMAHYMCIGGSIKKVCVCNLW